MRSLFPSASLLSTVIALLLGFFSGRANAIDFTPHYAQSVQDGFPVTRMYFLNQAQRIYVSVPHDWQVAGDSQRGTLMPKNFGRAAVIFENSPLTPKTAFAGENLEAYRRSAFGCIPAGATDVHTDVERQNEIQINGWTSFEMAFSYRFYGEIFSNAVIFINLDKDNQIRFRVVARKEHFEKLYPQARSTLASWFAPSPELEAVMARLAPKS
jgi:hypothetical protein